MEIHCFSYCDEAGRLPEGMISSPAVRWHAFSRRPLSMVARLAQELRRGPHVVLFTHVNLLRLARVVRLLAPEARIAVLGHGVEVWDPLPSGIRRALQSVEAVVAPSSYTREKLIAVNGVKESRIKVLGHGIDHRWWSQHSATSLSGRNGSHLLSVTRLSRADAYKGIDLTIQAMPKILQSIPTARYIIVGDGEDRTRLERIAAQAGVASHIEFRRELRDSELSQAYAEADVFVLPSLKEGFGIVFLEAMFFSLPIVAARAGGSTDVVVDGQTGFLVEPGNKEQLATAITRLLQDPEERNRIGTAGRTRLEQEFLFDHFANRWQHWLASLAPEAIYLARHVSVFHDVPAAA